MDNVEANVIELTGDVLLAYFLKVQLRKCMEPISNLANVEELDLKDHVCVWVTFPQESRICHKVLRREDAAAPHEREQVERRQLAGLVELAVFGFRQVQPPVHFVENIFLYQGVKDDRDEKVEKHSGHVFRAVLVEVHRIASLVKNLCYVVLDCDEHDGELGCDLEHQAEEDNHGQARHHVGVVLDDELVAQHRRALALLAEPHGSATRVSTSLASGLLPPHTHTHTKTPTPSRH